MKHNPRPANVAFKKEKRGCLRIVLILLGIGFLLFCGGCFYLYDQISGNADIRFEKKENKKLAKEILPDKYKSYPYLSELKSNDEYEVVPLGDFNWYYFLSDSTLTMGFKSGRNLFRRVSPQGEILDAYDNQELTFYGTSLIKYSIDELPKEDNATPEPVFSGYYSLWPLNGDTTLYPIQPIEKIISSKEEIMAAYNEADMTERIDYGLFPKWTLLHIGDIWYVSDYINEKQKYFHFRTGKNRFGDDNSLDNIGQDKMGIKIKYLKRTHYNRARSGAFVIGGAASGGSKAYWNGDVYLELKMGRLTIPFKDTYLEKKDWSGPYTSKSASLNVLRTSNYVIIDDYMIVQKTK